MSALGSLVVGIVSSLVATVLFLFLARIARTVIIPWFEDLIYKGVRLDGRWSVTVTSVAKPGQAQGPSFTLEQKGDKVAGVYTHDVDGKAQPYCVEGQIRNAYFTAALWPVSSKEIDTAAVLLRAYTHDGLKMAGILTIVDTSTGKVQAHEVLLKHVGS